MSLSLLKLLGFLYFCFSFFSLIFFSRVLSCFYHGYVVLLVNSTPFLFFVIFFPSCMFLLLSIFVYVLLSIFCTKNKIDRSKNNYPFFSRVLKWFVLRLFSNFFQCRQNFFFGILQQTNGFFFRYRFCRMTAWSTRY